MDAMQYEVKDVQRTVNPRCFYFLPLTSYLLLVLSGCTFWHNFSTFFNTVYLAKEHLAAYEEQQKAIVPANPNGAVAVLKHRWLDEEYQMRQRGLRNGSAPPITASFSQSLTATKQVNNIHLDSAIILGSKVLADKKGNKYQEDALYVVGKAEFLKNDFATAQRKFLELLSHYPETEYGSEVRILLARSMLTTRSFDSAGTALTQGLSAENMDKVGRSNIHRALAEYIYAKNPDSLGALANELHLAEEGLNGEELARLAYEEGMVYYLNGNWPEAQHAFELTYSNAKDEWLAGEAHEAHALALRRQSKHDEARAELQDVVEKVKYSGSHASARYDLALTDELAAREAVAGDLRSAEFKTTYHPKLYAEYYALDTAYRNSSGQILSRAKFRQAEMYREMGYYDSAAKQASTLAATKDFSTPAMNEYVAQRANSLASFAKWKQEMAHMDSVENILTPKGQKKARTEESELHLRALQEVLGPRWNPAAPVPLGHEDSLRLPNIELRLSREHKGVGKLVVGDTAHFLDSLRLRETQAHYQLGRAYETFAEVPEARAEYRFALTVPKQENDTARGVLDAQSLYAWMQLERNEKRMAVSDSLLRLLLTYHGQTIYAQQARMLFAATSLESPGEIAYREAYDYLRSHGFDAAKPRLLDLAASNSQLDVAARALYAIGVSYEEMGRYDSAVVYYRRVLKEYPYSAYAMTLKPRLADASGLPHAAPNPPDPTSLGGEVRSDIPREQPVELGGQLSPQEPPMPVQPAPGQGQPVPPMPRSSKAPIPKPAIPPQPKQ